MVGWLLLLLSCVIIGIVWKYKCFLSLSLSVIPYRLSVLPFSCFLRYTRIRSLMSFYLVAKFSLFLCPSVLTACIYVITFQPFHDDTHICRSIKKRFVSSWIQANHLSQPASQPATQYLPPCILMHCCSISSVIGFSFWMHVQKP